MLYNRLTVKFLERCLIANIAIMKTTAMLIMTTSQYVTLCFECFVFILVFLNDVQQRT